MNVHNSPRDDRGREDERDRAEAIEIAAIKAFAEDGMPVVLIGRLQRARRGLLPRSPRSTDLVAASGGSHDGGTCRPPAAMRVDWIFGSRSSAFSGFRIDTSPSRPPDHRPRRAQRDGHRPGSLTGPLVPDVLAQYLGSPRAVA